MSRHATISEPFAGVVAAPARAFFFFLGANLEQFGEHPWLIIASAKYSPELNALYRTARNSLSISSKPYPSAFACSVASTRFTASPSRSTASALCSADRCGGSSETGWRAVSCGIRLTPASATSRTICECSVSPSSAATLGLIAKNGTSSSRIVPAVTSSVVKTPRPPPAFSTAASSTLGYRANIRSGSRATPLAQVRVLDISD
mmetsp:Transcript_21904/g.58403  ORF Transcript_21904/g.58403 Transcript_21904/m.58403 type:complete len:204 (+) Transcript_21904:67-678(+)